MEQILFSCRPRFLISNHLNSQSSESMKNLFGFMIDMQRMKNMLELLYVIFVFLA